MTEQAVNLERLLKNQPNHIKKLIRAAYWIGARDFSPAFTEIEALVMDGVVSDTANPPALPMLLRRQAG